MTSARQVLPKNGTSMYAWIGINVFFIMNFKTIPFINATNECQRSLIFFPMLGIILSSDRYFTRLLPSPPPFTL